MNEGSDQLVCSEIRGRKVVYYLTTEDDLRNVKSNSLLGDAFSGFAALTAGGIISALLTRATGIQLAQETANLLDVLLYVFIVLTVIFACFAVYFHRESLKTIKGIRGSGAVTHLSTPDQPVDAEVSPTREAVVPSESRLKIIKAEYWTEKARLDVTAELRQSIVNDRLEVTASNDIKNDPDVGTKKRLTIEYSHGGVSVTRQFEEGEKVALP